MGFWLLVALAVAVVGTVGYLQYQKDQKRKALLAQWAFGNGWSITPRDDSWCQRWNGKPFGEGDHRRAESVISGAWKDRPFVSFDYTFQTHSSDGKGGRSTQTHRFAVTALHLPAYLPRLQLTPENLGTRFAEAVGLSPDIELESEEFNRSFRIDCRDPKFASDVLTPRTMQLLLGRSRFSWRIDGADMVCWQNGKQQPAVVIAAVTTLSDIVNGIPSFVWSDHGADGTPAIGGLA